MIKNRRLIKFALFIIFLNFILLHSPLTDFDPKGLVLKEQSQDL